jgi:glycosyltransferase involved in cell wall biosynthesis
MLKKDKKALNIWLVKIGEELPVKSGIRKLRTAMLAEKLIERGHFILWWASAFDHLRKKWVFPKEKIHKINENFSIYILKGIGYKKNISLARFIDHRIIAWRFKHLAPRMPRPDIIVASFPAYDLAYAAVRFAKSNNIPIIVDVRDQWPDLFLENMPVSMRGLATLVLHKDFVIAQKTLKKADVIISMMDAILVWGLKCSKRSRTLNDRVFYLGASKMVDKNVASPKILEIIRILNKKLIVTFIGTFAKYHNPSILLECAKSLASYDIGFVLAGDGECFEDIRTKANGMRNIAFPGWLNHVEINALLQCSHVGICPASKEAYFFPNKVFSYFSAGLPVISAFQGDLKKIIEKYQIGFYYPPNDIDALTASIDKLYQNKELYAKMAANSKKVFNEMLDADKIYDDYAVHIENIARGYKNEDV